MLVKVQPKRSGGVSRRKLLNGPGWGREFKLSGPGCWNTCDHEYGNFVVVSYDVGFSVRDLSLFARWRPVPLET